MAVVEMELDVPDEVRSRGYEHLFDYHGFDGQKIYWKDSNIRDWNHLAGYRTEKACLINPDTPRMKRTAVTSQPDELFRAPSVHRSFTTVRTAIVQCCDYVLHIG